MVRLLTLRSLSALLLGLAAFVLQGAALCGEAHAAPPVPQAAHCAGMAAASGADHAGDADQAPAPMRHACANACHPPVVAPSLPVLAPVALPLVSHGQHSLAGLSGLAPPPATPPPRKG